MSLATPPGGRARRAAGWLVRAAVASAVVYGLTFTPRSLQTLHLASRAGRGRSPVDTSTAFMTAADSAATPDFGGGAARRTAPGAPGGVPAVDWPTLGALDLRTGAPAPGAPGAALRQAAGRRVRVPGYIVPLDDGLDEVEEFLLVPYVGACIHVPPPPANQMIYVRMRGRPVKMEWWVPEWVEGTLTVSRVDSPYGAAGFSLDGAAVTRYQTDDPPP